MSDKPTMIVDIWWKAVLILGVLTSASSIMFDVDFIENRHLFGLGLGMIFIGIAQWMAWKTVSQVIFGGILSTKVIRHNIMSLIILIIGIGLIGLFGFLIVKGLV
jgi:hypothetical protein